MRSRKASWMFFVAFILLQELSMMIMMVEASRDPDLRQTTEKRSNGNNRFLRHSPRHPNKVNGDSTMSIPSYPKAGLRILVGRPQRTMSEATLYRLLPYEAVENRNTPERQIYQYKIFYGSKFTPHKKKKKGAHYKKHGHQTFPYHLKHKASRRIRHQTPT